MSKKQNLTPIEKFCLAGYHITKDADLAWKLSRPNEPTATPENVHRLALRWLRGKEQKKYLESLSATALNEANNSGESIRDKSDIVKELNALATSTHDPKLRAEILMKVADLERMKDEVSDEEEKEKQIHFYIPVSYPRNCGECLLWQNGKAKGQRNGEQ